MTLSNRFERFGTLEDPGKLWITFKHQTLEPTEEFIEHPKSRSEALSGESLDNIETSCADRLARNSDQYSTVKKY